MIKDKIIIKGESPYKTAVKRLVDRCEKLCTDLEIEKVVLVLDNEVHKSADTENLAVPSTNRAYTGESVLTYSQTDRNANIMALNLQSHNSKKSFELLYGFHMGRVYMNRESEFTVYPVLCFASALIAGKADVKRVIDILNYILK